ncbi:metal-dependent hydrolase [Candidatus Pacearchaeota archaeon]|nr:metal-dependent hydrolase [Candidatus Pacearchaeota archaeon]
MAQAVTHILVPLILIALFRDFYWKRRKNAKNSFPLHYVLIAGLSGILPDIDLVLYWIFGSFGLSVEAIHRTFTHSIFFPLVFLILFFVLKNGKIPGLGRHKLKINVICLMIAFGSFVHLILDAVVTGKIIPLYPLNNYVVGLNIVQYLPQTLQGLAMPTLDGILLIIWLVYLEWKHKIGDFI